MTETNAQQRHLIRQLAQEIGADPRRTWVPRARAQNDAVKSAVEDLIDSHRIVALDLDINSQDSQRLVQIPGKGIVVVDQ